MTTMLTMAAKSKMVWSFMPAPFYCQKNIAHHLGVRNDVLVLSAFHGSGARVP
jgi:hypothetical protein